MQGTLFLEFVRYLKEIKPKITIGENIKELLYYNSGKTLATMVFILE
jgi:DNA (cytosine-5)-methyltransferase 1